VRFLLNRANSKVGLKRSEVEAAVGVKVDVEVPSERAVPLAVNRGNPAVLSDPGCDFSHSMRELASTLFPVPKKRGGRRLLPALSKA
jgi:pilus assembly protein CpaE